MRNRSFRLSAVVFSAIALLSSACSRESRIRERLEKADRDFAAGRYDEAEIGYKNALKLNPQNAVPVTRLGTIYQEQGRLGAAIAYLTQAKRMAPDDVETRVKLAVALIATGNLAAARDEALFVLSKRPAESEVPLILAETARNPKELADVRQRLEALPPNLRSTAGVLVGMGQLELRAGRTTEAEAAFRQALVIDPKAPNAHMGLAMVALMRKDPAAAETAFKSSIENAPPRSPRRLQYARYKLQSGDTAAATAILQETTRTAPDSVPPWLWLAEIALTEKRYDDADSYITNAMNRDSLNPEAMLLNGRIRLARGETDKAIIAFESMTGAFPNGSMGHYQLGLARSAKGELSRAKESFTKAVALSPEFSPAILALGELNLRTGDFGAAVATLSPFAEKHPEVPTARLMLAEAYRAQGNLDSALAVATELAKQFPTNAPTESLRGVILRQQNKPDAAIQAFIRAAELAPDSFAALDSVIDLELATRKVDAALKRANAAVARSPKAAQPLVLLAKVQLAKGDTAGATETLQRAIAINPSLSAPYQLLARIFLSSKQYPAALANLKEASAKNPKDTAALTQLAVLHDMQNEAEPARAAYERVLAAEPNSVVALNNLAFLYAERLDKLDRAYDLGQRARSLAPDDPHVSDTLGWIQFKRREFASALALLQDSASKMADEQDAQLHLALTHYMLVQETPARAAFQRITERWPALAARDDIKLRIALLAIDPSKQSEADKELATRAAARDAMDPVAWSHLASWHLSRNDLSKARAAADSALKASPGSAVVLTQLARISEAQGRRDEAIAFAKDARAAAPGNVESTHLLGNLARAAGQHRWAASLLREAAGMKADDPELLYDSALAAYYIGEVSDATDGVQRALRLNPNFNRAADARRFLELVAVTPESVMTADEAQIRKTIAVDPASVAALMAGAVLSEARKDWRAAQESYEKTLVLCPDFGPAQKALALRYAAGTQSTAGMLGVAGKARQTYPSDAEVAKALGILSYQQGDNNRAVTLLQESAVTRTNDGELLYYLGLGQLRAKQTSEARKTLQLAIEAGLRADLATDAKRALATAK